MSNLPGCLWENTVLGRNRLERKCEEKTGHYSATSTLLLAVVFCHNSVHSIECSIVKMGFLEKYTVVLKLETKLRGERSKENKKKIYFGLKSFVKRTLL